MLKYHLSPFEPGHLVPGTANRGIEKTLSKVESINFQARWNLKERLESLPAGTARRGPPCKAPGRSTGLQVTGNSQGLDWSDHSSHSARTFKRGEVSEGEGQPVQEALTTLMMQKKATHPPFAVCHKIRLTSLAGSRRAGMPPSGHSLCNPGCIKSSALSKIIVGDGKKAMVKCQWDASVPNCCILSCQRTS